MIGEPLRPVPKPVRAPKEPKGLRQVSAKRQARIDAGEERPGLAPGGRLSPKGDTAYANRERLWGFMCFVRRTLPCVAKAIAGAGPCIGAVQFMHLGPRAGYRKCHDSQGGAGCVEHHDCIDNPRGFYLDMAEQERADFRARVIADTWAAWMALTPEQREWWDGEAARERAANRDARRAMDAS